MGINIKLANEEIKSRIVLGGSEWQSIKWERKSEAELQN